MWIIAVSLLAIAVCVVVDSIERQRVRRDSGGPSPATISSDEPVPSAELRAVRFAARPQREPSTGTSAPENLQPTNPVADNAGGPDVAVLPAAHATVGGPQPAGYSVSGISQGSNPMGEITGRITLNGTPPPETIITTTDPICSKRSAPLMTRTFVVGESNGLADAVVFVKRGIDAALVPLPTNTAVVLYTNCEVQPYITAVVSRQPIKFRNREDVLHTLTLGDKTPRNLIVPPNTEQQFRFTQPHLFVPVQCREHPWESSFVCVLDNPYFAVTDSDGFFDIPDVPPGTYTIEVAHQRATGTNGVTRSVIVVAGKKAELNVTLNVPGAARHER